MKISFVANNRFPEERGMSFSIVSKCLGYRESGHEVELVAPRRVNRDFRRVDFWRYYQVPKNAFALRYLPCWEIPEASVFENIAKHFRYFILGWSFALSAWLYLRRTGSRMVQIYNDFPELAVLFRATQFIYKPKLVVEIHVPAAGRYGWFLERVYLPRVDLLAPITRGLARHYRRLGVPGRKIIVSPGGVRLGDFNYTKSKTLIRKELNLPFRARIVGYAGRFVSVGEERGIPDFIRAAARLNKSGNKIFLVCVGGPDDLVEKYRKLALDFGLAEKDFRFLGHVPPLTLKLYERAFDVCVLPYPDTEHNRRDVSSLKLFEYMASRNPIVATGLPSTQEVLATGKNALLVCVDDPISLSKGIQKVLGDKKLRSEIARNAYRLVATKFTWQKRAENILRNLEDT